MEYVKTFLIGLWMWACDIVPGVSGGTIAFISWIYQKLISSIKLCLSLDTIKLLFGWKIIEAWYKVNGTFLLSLFGGVLISIVLLSSLLESLLLSHPQLVWWLFAWLIVASVLLLVKQQNKWWTKEIFAVLVWGVVAWWVTQITPTQVTPHWWVIVWSAMIAISAMILPWLSGSFLLLIMWMYGHVIWAISGWDITFLWLFVVGVILWLATFVRLVSRAFQKFYNTTIAVLIGFMIWALPKLWPWQNALKTIIDRHWEEIVLQSESVMPNQYTWEPMTFWVVALFFVWCIWSFIIFSTIDQDLKVNINKNI